MPRFPDAVQREVVHRCSGTFADSECVKVPGLQRTTTLRFVLRCARETVQEPAASAFSICGLSSDSKLSAVIGPISL
jgi:hypothetical protein